MSNYGHFTQQYYGNRISFPLESFKIRGISYYQNDAKNVDYSSELIMKLEMNEYSMNAIAIYHEKNKIGYVPQESKDLCMEYITDKLHVINIKRINNIIGIRVIPQTFLDSWDEKSSAKAMFAD